MGNENSRLKEENLMLKTALEVSKLKINDLLDSNIYENYQEIIKYKDGQLTDLEKRIEEQVFTIRSLQENMLKSQVHKIPQYQKTIMFLNESVRKLQDENDSLKEKLKSLQKKMKG